MKLKKLITMLKIENDDETKKVKQELLYYLFSFLAIINIILLLIAIILAFSGWIPGFLLIFVFFGCGFFCIDKASSTNY